MREIVVYVEGGGDTVDQRRKLRQGFDRLFSKTKDHAPRHDCSLRFVCSGSRKEAYDDFRAALEAHHDRVNALLVDAETPFAGVTAGARTAHLTTRDGWDFAGIEPERIHLMVQCMEAWIVADPDALEGYYRQGFRRNALPVRPNLEEEAKQDIYNKLSKATKGSRTKGEYGKGQHACELLQRIDPVKVAERCPHFTTFTQWLEKAIKDA